ncbi:DUF460 domain-containing protein, partial [Candidatus Woesearchaeota archaeon]|nr:DUF460 domain-containing protein [Candidatus Woesearchaeota archaeon]
MLKRLLVVGLDPGTTVGYAALDLDGKPILVTSAKQLPLQSVIAEIIGLGVPVLVGCDKAHPPGFVQRFAKATGARVVAPKADLSPSEKKCLAAQKTRNAHERDALASARFAYKRSKVLIQKLSKATKGVKDEVKLRVYERILKEEGININEELKPKEEAKRVARPKRLPQPTKPSLVGVYKRELDLVRAQNERLKRELAALKRKLQQLQNKMAKEIEARVAKRLDEKEELIKEQRAKLKALKAT